MFNNELWQKPTGGAAGGNFYTHQIANSSRFLLANSSYMHRTPSSAGNRRTWTFSTWIKRTKFDINTSFFGATRSGYENVFRFDDEDNVERLNTFGFTGSSADFNVRTTASYRDSSAWMHIVIAMDTTQGTASNRLKLYVNGEQQTDLANNSYPSQNYDTNVNDTSTQTQVGFGSYGGQYFDGYMAESVLIDGTQYAASDFGETVNGVWIPKDPSGLTFGTNGFYLKYESSSNLGNDSSGNNNDLTVSGLSAHDQMKDSPTFGSEGSANYPTINMLDPTVDATAISNGNLQITEGNQRGGKATFAVPLTGKWYWEAYCYADTAQEMWNGITGITTNSSGDGRGGSSNSNTYGASWSQYSGSNYYIRKYIAGVESAVSGSFGTTKHTILGIAINRDDNEAKFYKDNALQFTATISATQEYFPAGGMGGGTNATTIQVWNFGQDGTFAGNKTAQGNADGNGYGNFYYSPPSGHLALNSANLPTADAVDPAQTDDDYPQELFSPVLYTGNGSSQSVTGVGFQPDWTWIKNRNDSQGHKLFDSSRGVTKVLSSHNSDAESTESGLSAFGSDGFSLGGSTVAGYNTSSNTYVAWNWRANGSGSSNSDGATSSTVQASPGGGFSIVTYTGFAGSSGTSTVGHGMGVAPNMIIFKSRTRTSAWWTAVPNILASQSHFLELNGTSAPTDLSSYGTISAPTTSVFTINGVDGIGGESANYVAYCFANVDGFCRVGSYVGNGQSTDNAFVFTGFRPAFVLTKGIRSGDGWNIHDNATSPFNVADTVLQPNTSSAELSNYNIDMLSNGFKVRDGDGDLGSSGATYIYLAFAKNPFKYATAR